MTDDLTPQNPQTPQTPQAAPEQAAPAKKGRIWPWLLGIGCAGILLVGALAVVAFFVFKKSDSPGLMAFFGSDKGEAVEQEADEPSDGVEPAEQASDEDGAQEIDQDRIAALQQEIANLKEQQAGSTEQAKQAVPKQPASAVMPSSPQLAPKPDGAAPATTVPGGTKLAVALNPQVSTATHNANDPWQGTLAQAIAVNGKTVWPAGTRVSGIVQQSAATGRLSNGKGILTIQLLKIGSASINGGVHSVTGEPKAERNAKVIGGTAALGAVVGALSKKNNKADSALGGAVAGAAVGTAAAAATADTTVKISGTVTFTLPADARI